MCALLLPVESGCVPNEVLRAVEFLFLCQKGFFTYVGSSPRGG